MSDSLTSFLVTVELIVFFVFDFVFASILNKLKSDHPELEECAPEDSPDLDPVAVMDSLRHTAVKFYNQNQWQPGGVARASYEAMYPSGEDEMVLPPVHKVENALHNFVVICGFVAPVVLILQVLLPGAFGWCRLDMPVWIAYIGVVPGLATVIVFAARVMNLASMIEINRQQWITAMWFRLDFMCIMSAVAFLGGGAWVVMLCMLSVAFYLAHRVMLIEKRLSDLAHETQLVRGEVDLEHVYPPGSVEAARAMASSDVQGYSAMNK